MITKKLYQTAKCSIDFYCKLQYNCFKLSHLVLQRADKKQENYKEKKEMKKIIGIMLLVCATILCFASCASNDGNGSEEQPPEHQHTWTDATYENPSECSECGEKTGSSLKEMLTGEWREEGQSASGIYISVFFTDSGFSHVMMMNGERLNSWSDTQGIVKVEGEVINLCYENGEVYMYFNYSIVDNKINLVDYSSRVWVKAED